MLLKIAKKKIKNGNIEEDNFEAKVIKMFQVFGPNPAS